MKDKTKNNTKQREREREREKRERVEIDATSGEWRKGCLLNPQSTKLPLRTSKKGREEASLSLARADW